MALIFELRQRLGALWRPRKKVGDVARFAAQFAERLERWPMPVNGRGQRVGVLVTPWISTPVPFFSLECARMLAQAGQEVTLLWDDRNVFFNALKRHEIDAVQAIARRLPAGYRVLDVSARDPAPNVDTGFLDLLLYENSVRQVRGEKAGAELLRDGADRSAAMREHARRIHTLLAEEHFDSLFIPGGVWAVSGLWTNIATQSQVPFTTFDSGNATLFLGHDGPAAHFPDVPRAWNRLQAEAGEDERESMRASARTELQRRMEGLDEFRLQPKPAGADTTATCDLLVPLNYRSDTAALCRQRLFPSVSDWLTQLLRWAEQRGGVTVAIRQHPCERIPEYRGSDRWEEMLAPFTSMGSRLKFIAAEDPVNTYDLMAAAKAVLPYTSRVGIEAAMCGKPVILGAHCYYEDCGFAAKAESVPQYLEMVEAALAGELSPSPEARDAAALVYYLAEKCLALRTYFTPQPFDFARWVTIAPDELWSEPANEDVRTALLTREPVPLICHRRHRAAALPQC